MKFRPALLIVVVSALAVGAWMALRPPDLPDLGAPRATPSAAQMTEANAASVQVAPKLGAAAVLSIDPRNQGLGGATRPRATLHNEYLAAKTLRPLLDRLANSTEGLTAEGLYVQYEILKRCATITERTTRQPIVRSTEQRREEFLAALPANDPQRDKRIAAFDDVATNRCAGMENVSIKQADLNKMLLDAAALGDPKARAAALEQELWQARRADGRWRSDVAPTDAQIEALRGAISSRDPEAMLIAGRVLSSSWHDFSMRIGAGDQVVEQRSFLQAWQLLACDYGYPCGSDNQRLLSACAYQGHCNAQTLPDYIFYYGASPYDSQLLTQYREVLRNAIETGNWSQLSVVRGPVPASARATNNPPGPGR